MTTTRNNNLTIEDRTLLIHLAKRAVDAAERTLDCETKAEATQARKRFTAFWGSMQAICEDALGDEEGLELARWFYHNAQDHDESVI